MFDSIKSFFSNNKKIILIGAGALLVVVIVIFSLPTKKTEKPAETTKIPGQEIAAVAPTIKKTELTDADKTTSAISILGKNFAQIYGSYSNQSNYSNIESALPLLSAKYKAEMSQVLSGFRASYQPGAKYEGITTVAMSDTLENLDLKSGVASLIVKTQRKISTGTQANYTIKYQDIRLEMVKEGDAWFVDSAKWIQ
ncbi:MAG: hypothetical protein V1661_02145 [bacterium]